MKREQRGRTRHGGKSKPSRQITTTSSRDPHHTITVKSTRRRGHLYQPNAQSQHLQIHDPNIIMVSATTPINKTINYILTRIKSIADLNAARAAAHTGSTSEPALETVIVAGANSAIQTLVTIIEILKRRCPQLLYNISIGTINNAPRLAAAGAEVNATAVAAATTDATQQPQTTAAREANKPTTTMSDDTNNRMGEEKAGKKVVLKDGKSEEKIVTIVPKHNMIAYGMQVTLLVQELVDFALD